MATLVWGSKRISLWSFYEIQEIVILPSLQTVISIIRRILSESDQQSLFLQLLMFTFSNLLIISFILILSFQYANQMERWIYDFPMNKIFFSEWLFQKTWRPLTKHPRSITRSHLVVLPSVFHFIIQNLSCCYSITTSCSKRVKFVSETIWCEGMHSERCACFFTCISRSISQLPIILTLKPCFLQANWENLPMMESRNYINMLLNRGELIAVYLDFFTTEIGNNLMLTNSDFFC